MSLGAALSGFISGAGLIVAIGAQNAFVLRQGLKRQSVVAVITICALGDIVLIVCGVLGIGALVNAWPEVLFATRIAGAVFLGIYGVLAARRAWRGSEGLTPGIADAPSRRRVLLTCLAFTFLNPHVYLDTVVLLGSISTRYAGVDRWIFALGACAASLAWFSLLGYGARLLLPIFRSPHAWRVLDGSIAVFMLVLSAALLWHPIV
ncbi:LysE/ArgO family amino acid transporter [Alcaligenaceae bacterium A4P071]|nr:LysE/ArgO family amino acid transporter [Alcaligenaceae bacterium A4P071]